MENMQGDGNNTYKGNRNGMLPAVMLIQGHELCTQNIRGTLDEFLYTHMSIIKSH